MKEVNIILYAFQLLLISSRLWLRIQYNHFSFIEHLNCVWGIMCYNDTRKHYIINIALKRLTSLNLKYLTLGTDLNISITVIKL